MKNTFRVIIPAIFVLVLSGCKKDTPPADINYASISDIDGNSYKTIAIGTQNWMTENLKAIHYSNGDPVLYVTDNTQWSGLTTGAYCWYANNETQYKSDYGALYNFYAVTDSRNICPTGWRVPTQSDWNTLGSFLLGNSVAGGKLKETGTAHWYAPNEFASDEVKFASLPGGDRVLSGPFEMIGQTAEYWTSTEFYFYFISFEAAILGAAQSDKRSGYSVRCIK